jgi:multiple sugar transport system permease protein
MEQLTLTLSNIGITLARMFAFLAGLLVVVGVILMILRPKSRAKYFFLLPGVLWILAFTLFPLVYSLVLSFTNAVLGRPTTFNGLNNYARIFSDRNLHEAVSVSVFLTLGSLTLTLLLGVFVAWLFNHDLPGIKRLRAIITMPLFAAPIALGYLGVIIFNENAGPVNNVIRALGGDPVKWITDAWSARVAVLITDVWQWTPFVFIVVLAAMQGISEELYESARLDTSSNWSLFRNITFPLIAPALGTVALLRLVETFKILDIPRTLTVGGPGQATRTFSYYAYQTGLVSPFNQGYASAQAYVVVILCIIISSVYFARVRDRFE